MQPWNTSAAGPLLLLQAYLGRAAAPFAEDADEELPGLLRDDEPSSGFEPTASAAEGEDFAAAEIDLDDGCPSLVTTAPGGGGVVGAETATEFVARTGAVLSINVPFYYPMREYPH